MNPTLAGFLAFISGVMGISTAQLPSNAPIIPFVYNLAVNTVNPALALMSNADTTQPTLYATAIYNLAGDLLIQLAPDQTGPPPSTYFAGLRTNFGCNSFVGGVINSTSDNSTSEGMELPEFVKGLTIGQLQNLKTPYGRAYLAIAQGYGTLWGLS